DEIFQYTGQTWRNIEGLAVNVGVGADGTVWVVNRFDQIYAWNGIGWTNVPGALVQISVGDKSQVWGVNRADNIFYRTNGDILNGTWVQVPGLLINVSVASDGTVWGVSRNRDIFRWNGKDWIQIGGKLKQIYTSSESSVVGIDINNNVLQYKDGQWLQYKDIKLENVAISIDNNLWGIDSMEEIYMFQPNSTTSPLIPTSSTSPTISSTVNINQGNPARAIIGLRALSEYLTIAKYNLQIMYNVKEYSQKTGTDL
ncbi:18023_t:CDS:2, partial [Rhizophagus irregularis]